MMAQRLIGQDNQIRTLLADAVRSGNRLDWSPDELMSTKDVVDLLPLNDFLSDEEFNEQVTVLIPTHRQFPIGAEAFSKQCKTVLLCNNGFVVYSAKTETHVLSWEGHGQTRQNGVTLVETPYVFFSVDDAVPMGGMIRRLVEVMQSNEWDAVIPRQIPWPDADPFTIGSIRRWTPYRNQVYSVSQSDHVGTLYRRSDLLKSPLPNVPIAEDAWWSMGKRIACVPDAVLLHSHQRKMLPILKREASIHNQLRLMGKERPYKRRRELVMGSLSSFYQYGWREGCRTSLVNAVHFGVWH